MSQIAPKKIFSVPLQKVDELRQHKGTGTKMHKCVAESAYKHGHNLSIRKVKVVIRSDNLKLKHHATSK